MSVTSANTRIQAVSHARDQRTATDIAVLRTERADDMPERESRKEQSEGDQPDLSQGLGRAHRQRVLAYASDSPDRLGSSGTLGRSLEQVRAEGRRHPTDALNVVTAFLRPAAGFRLLPQA
ncbi:hypothetical protein FJZ36_18330 [Candidatus Poribacteria bacterium]|nr:hypothetical protein [Candidatus Poribacteria bacterium]